jgi:hypothetical protein
MLARLFSQWARRWAAAVAVMATPWFGMSCSQNGDVHLFFAAPYVPSSDCLDDVVVVDVLNGSDPGRCPQVLCWLNPYNQEAYVSLMMCDGPMDWTRVDHPASGSVCEAALAAYQRAGDGSCSRDAGSGDTGAADGGTVEAGELDTGYES